MFVLIIGLGISGQAVRAFCEKRGDRITIYDDEFSPELPPLNEVDLAVKSPGVSFSHPLIEALRERKIPILSEIELALREIKDKTLYAITGSNGKTTTTLLASHLLNLAGRKAVAVGNVGVSVISQLDSDAECFVIELSSFQLESLTPAPYFDGGAILNITPNHLDRHKTFEAYVSAKLRLQKCMKTAAPFYTSRAVAEQFHLNAQIFDLETLSSIGYRRGDFYSHDLENIAAAYALTGVDRKVLKEGVATFVKPPHRLEFVREWRGITFINDSKATSVDAVKRAVEALSTPVILIAGGVDKGGAYEEWLPCFGGRVKKLLVFGEAADLIASALREKIVVERVSDLEEAVKRAAQIAQKGETVLLSPGCSSYDQFKSYEHRGDRFKEMVCALEEISR